MRRLRGVSAALLLALLTLGSPAALIRFGHLRGLFTIDWGRVFSLPDDGRLVLGLLTVTGWLAWLLWTLVVLVDMAGRLAGRRWRLPTLGFVQGVVAALIVAVLALGKPTPGFAAPAPARHVLVLEQPVAVGSGADASTDVAEFGAPVAVADTKETGYIVQPGDDLWTIAQRLLGDGMLWRDIAAANPQVVDPAHIEPGWLLVVPGWTPPGAETTAQSRDGSSESTPSTAGDSAPAPSAPAPAGGPTTSGAPSPKPPGPSATADPPADSGPTGPTSAETPPAQAPASPTQTGPTPAADQSSTPTVPHPVGTPSAGIPSAQASTPSAASDTAEPSSAATALPPFSATPARWQELPSTGEQVGAAAAQRSTPPPAPSVEAHADPSGLQLALGIGGFSATAILAALALQRARQHFRRELGRRAPEGSPDARRLEAILGVMDDPSGLSLLETAQRAIAAHCRGRGLPLVEHALLSGDRLVWQLARPSEPPPGFTADGARWIVVRSELGALGAPAGPLAYPGLLPVGTTPDGATLLIDLERAAVLGVAGVRAAETIAALLLDAVVAPWSAERDVVATIGYADLATAADEEIRLVEEPADAVVGRPLPVEWREQRLDPDRAPDLAPCLAFLDTELRRIDVPPGTAIVMPSESADWQLDCDRGELRTPAGRYSLRPPRLTPELSRSVADLFASATSEATDVAPWWSLAPSELALLPLGAAVPDAPFEPETLVTDPPAQAPELLLLGAIDLVGCQGEQPARALRQCMEYAGWLLEHPGGTASQMASDLMIAEGTRRSNLSRLRTWLGADPQGQPYLPEAYSGRLELHPLVTSDWRRLQLLAAPGVNRLRAPSLTAALSLVRGAPLADAAPGQWHWAEPMRSDMVALIRDIGVQLASLALAEGDVDLVRWATARALAAAPEDELLLCARIRAEAALGNRAEVERLAWRLTQHARALGVELREDTVVLLQEVVEGHVRARAVG